MIWIIESDSIREAGTLRCLLCSWTGHFWECPSNYDSPDGGYLIHPDRWCPECGEWIE